MRSDVVVVVVTRPGVHEKTALISLPNLAGSVPPNRWQSSLAHSGACVRLESCCSRAKLNTPSNHLIK